MLIIASLPEASLPRRCSPLARPALPLQDGGYARGNWPKIGWSSSAELSRKRKPLIRRECFCAWACRFCLTELSGLLGSGEFRVGGPNLCDAAAPKHIDPIRSNMRFV